MLVECGDSMSQYDGRWHPKEMSYNTLDLYHIQIDTPPGS
jgi:hypothetical protein